MSLIAQLGLYALINNSSFYQLVLSNWQAEKHFPVTTSDIEGETTKKASIPDIDGGEILSVAVDAGISQVLPPATPFAPGQQMVSAVLKNFGTDTLQSVVVFWAVNDTLQSPIPWAGNLLPGDSLGLDLGQGNFSINQAYNITAWTRLPNGMGDTVEANDSSSVDSIYAGLAGIYTIGGEGPDFNTFTEAATNLNLGGILDEVTFNVRDGAYNEQLYLTEAPGLDTLKTATFQSESGDSSLVTLSYSADAGANYTCMLNGADWIRLKNMTLEATNSPFGVVLDYRNGANNNRFENCEFRGVNTSSISIAMAVIHSPDDGFQDEHNAFLNNYVRNGSMGFFLAGNSSNREKGLRLEHNRIEGSYNRGMNIAYAEAPLIHGNTFQASSSYFNAIGIYLEECSDSTRITKNQVFGFTRSGIFLNNCNGTPASSMLIANNFIQLAGSGPGEGIYTIIGAYQKFYYNTVQCNNPDAGSAAFYSSQGNDKEVLNNLLVNSGGGYAVYFPASNGIIRSDHNNLYATGPNLGYWNGDQLGLAAWTAASTLDSNSVSVAPAFAGGTDLHVTDASVDGVATPVPEVADDIDGEPRDPISPDCGADEGTPPQLDVAVLSVNPPMMPFAADIHPIYVTISNNGLNTLTAATVNWEVNGALQPAFNWTGSLPPAQTLDSINIGAFIFEVNTPYSITAWASNPNGMADEVPANDTASVNNLYAALDGIYTIGGTGPDFPDFTSAAQALADGGVIGEVVFNIRDGIYNEQISIPEVAGASASNTITFRSGSNDSTAVRLTYGAATGMANYTLQLDGADWIRFEKMTLENTSPNHARVVDIGNGATNNRFANNEIRGPVATSNSDSYALVYSAGFLTDDNNHFAGNRLVNGSFGFHYTGLAPFVPESGTVIENNSLENQYAGGIFSYFQNVPIFKGNNITNTSNSQASYNGIYCEACDNGLQFTENELILASGSAGISVAFSSGSPIEAILIANNFVSLSGNGVPTKEGIRVFEAWSVNLYHNNVRLSAQQPDSRAVFLSGGNGINMVNNVLANFGGYVIYNESPGNISTSDYNDLFSQGPNFGYWGSGAIPGFNAWKSTTSQDANSISINPQFNSSMDLHVGSEALNGAALPLPEIAQDIDGDPRDPLAPDIGADEFTPAPTNDAGISGIAYPSLEAPFANGLQPVEVVIQNKGMDTLNSATINWWVNGSPQSAYDWTGALLPGEQDTVNIGNFNFALKTDHDILAYTSLPNGVTDSLALNDSTLVEGLYAGLDGPYTIGGVFPDFLSFSEAAATLSQGGILGPVVFNVRNGTYEEQISLGVARGSGPANTITFQSESGDSSLVILTNDISFPDYTVKLEGTDYVTFRNMTIQAGLATSSTVIEIANGVDSFSLLNCRIIAPPLAFDDLIKSSGDSLGNTLAFRHNAFSGGGYAINLAGHSGQLLTGIEVDSNTFEWQADGAVKLEYADAPLIRGNTLSGQGSGTNYFGLFLRYCDNQMKILGNKITHPGGFGILLFSCDADFPDMGLTANNFIHLEGDASTGLYINTCTFQHFYHNTIHAAGTNTNSRALGAIYGGNNVLMNNILANSAGGYAIHATSSGSLAGSDHNNLYATGSRLGNWGGADVADLPTWQLLSGLDGNSIPENPLFYSDTNLHVLQVALDSAAVTLPEITIDIDGEARNLNFPDIGADEFDYLEDDVGIAALVAPVDGCELGNAEAVKVAIQNFGGLPQTGFEVSYSLGGGPDVVENVGPLVVQPGDTAHFTFSIPVDVSAYQQHAFELGAQLATDLNPGNDILNTTATNFQEPEVVTNMLPADGSLGLGPPLNFSWQPSQGATRYDLYLWLASEPQPDMPIGQDLFQITFAYNSGNWEYGATYNWQVVAKNNFCETAGPVQSFTLRELPELEVQNVQLPAMPFSGQSIELSWEIHNSGFGSTAMESWYDYIYLSLDNVYQPNIDTYLGGFINLTALDAGQSYAQMKEVTLPQGIQGTYYIFVVTDYNLSVQEVDEDNNVSAAASMPVTLTPPPDLVVTSIIAPNQAFSGTSVNINWTVENQGAGDVPAGNSFQDLIYFSQYEAFDPFSSYFLGSYQSAPIAAGAFHTRNQTVQLPQGVLGDYYIHIVTDAEEEVFEFASENNNVGTSDAIDMILTPPPDLVVTSFATPATGSNKKSALLQWTVENQGATAAGSGYFDRVYISNYDTYHPDSVTYLGQYNTTNNLAPGAFVNRSAAVSIPDEISGTHYFYLVVDVLNAVFEFDGETNNIVRSNSLEVLNADLVVSSSTVADTVSAGADILVDWTVENQGMGDVAGIAQVDSLFISDDPVYQPGDATFLATLEYDNALLAGQSAARQQTVTIPNGLSGTYYIHVLTDADNDVFEHQDEGNNHRTDTTWIQLPPWPDLRVDSITMLPDTAVAGTSLTIAFEVKNYGQGSVPATASWKDRAYISAEPVWTPSAVTSLNTASLQQGVAPDSTYTRSLSFMMPMLQGGAGEGTRYVYLYTDVEDDLYEHTDEGNNFLRSDPIVVLSPPNVDFNILNATALPDTVWSGQPVNLQWMVRNDGSSTRLWNYQLWNDGIFLSEDSVWVSGDAALVQDFSQDGPLGELEMYSDNQSFNIPNGISGDYYAFLVADHLGQTNNTIGSDSNGVWKILPGSDPGSFFARPIHIRLSPSPDFSVSSLAHPADAIAGQPIQVVWTVQNNGTDTAAGRWTDKLYLSTDFFIDGNDPILGTQAQERMIPPGQSYMDTLEVFIPNTAAGNFILVFRADANNSIYEFEGEDDNTFFSYLTASLPPPSDLVVDAASFDTAAVVGESFTVAYTLLNQGANPATGKMKDLVYFSADPVLDAADARLTGPLERDISLAPGQSDTASATGLTPGVPLGEYFVIVQTDILNNIYESADTNNVYVSPGKVTVCVQELPLDSLVADTLVNNTGIYYRIEIVDSLTGETLLLSLDGQIAEAANELYLSYGEMPTRSAHQYAFSEPFAPDQEILVPEIQAGTYYFLAYGSTNTPAAGEQQAVGLKAEIIPFQIREVLANKGGNNGSATVRLEGARFEPSMQVRLEGDSFTVYGQDLIFVNSTTVFVTFDLAAGIYIDNWITDGVFPGLYDVVIRKASGETASLVDGFEILEGELPSLAIALSYPPNARFNRVVPMILSYSNDSNVDIPVPLVSVLSLQGAPVALTPEGLDGGYRDVALQLAEEGGPPGVLRPGAVGTVTVYAYSSAPMFFKLVRLE